MKGMWRAKSRVVGSLGMPIFFLIFLGLGLEHASMPGLPAGVDYVAFLTFIREHRGGTVEGGGGLMLVPEEFLKKIN